MHTVVGTFLEATMHDLIKIKKMLLTSHSHYCDLVWML